MDLISPIAPLPRVLMSSERGKGQQLWGKGGETRDWDNQFLVNESTSTRGLLLVRTFLSCGLLISLDHISYHVLCLLRDTHPRLTSSIHSKLICDQL